MGEVNRGLVTMYGFSPPAVMAPERIFVKEQLGEEHELSKEYYEFDTGTNEITPVESKHAMEKARGIFSRMDKWKVFKQASSLVASGCASAVVVKCVENSMPENMSLLEKVVAKVGLYFISGLISAKISEQVEEDLDEWKETILKAVEETPEKEIANGGAEA